jgi:hypothetical protein
MAWDFLKKIVSGKEGHDKPPAPQDPLITAATAGTRAHAAAPAPVPPTAPKAVKEKAPADKTDDELAAELDKMSPQILAQAKDPQMRAMIIGIYRKMLVAGVDVSDDKEVKKWMKKHPEVLQGGETIKVETVRREEPKVGRNDPCTCGSGKKYKKCCGQGK